VSGLVDLADGYGFVRTSGYQRRPADVYVSAAQVRQYGLRKGDKIEGTARPGATGRGKFAPLARVDTINGMSPELARARPHFDDLTPLYPEQRLRLEDGDPSATSRIIDLIAPIGKGQRGLIQSPPKAGKTTLLKTIANSISVNHPEVFLIVLLVDERPEEVTDIRRSVHGQVVSSTFDELPENHIRVAEMVLEESKRLVESGRDVVVLLDSLTRLARASNLTVNPSGRTLTGGLDPAAMYRPKRFFGAARNIEGGGSLTIISTALVETGSRMDDFIFEEFKGTGNWEIKLDRTLQERRVFPAIDIKSSGTRHDELLYDEETLKQIWKLHRVMASLDTVKATEMLIDRLRHTKMNKEFLTVVDKTFKDNELD